MKERILKNRILIDSLIILIISIFLCIPLLSQKTNVYFDDGIQHIARAFGTFNSIKNGGILNNVIASFANNYGYSWNLFYGPLSTYGIIILNLIIKSYIMSYKIFSMICLFLSGFFMYKFSFKLIRDNNAALLSSIFYMVFPYHLTDLYLRGALRRICFFYIYTTRFFRIIQFVLYRR